MLPYLNTKFATKHVYTCNVFANCYDRWGATCTKVSFAKVVSSNESPMTQTKVKMDPTLSLKSRFFFYRQILVVVGGIWTLYIISHNTFVPFPKPPRLSYDSQSLKQTWTTCLRNQSCCLIFTFLFFFFFFSYQLFASLGVFLAFFPFSMNSQTYKKRETSIMNKEMLVSFMAVPPTCHMGNVPD